MRPLQQMTSIKQKFSVVIGIAILASSAVATAGIGLGLPLVVAPLLAIAVALVLVQLVARGMTAPLRQMARAAQAVRGGRFDVRVDTANADEVGQLATAFNEMVAQLATTDALRRELVANAAHELRTPLTGLQATIENMLDGVTAVDPRHLEGLHGQVTRLALLVDQLLDLSQLDAGTASLAVDDVDLGNVVAAAAHDLSALAARRGIVLQVDVPQAAIVAGDRVRLRQVVTNLLDNAIGHSPDGEVVTATVTGPDDGSVRLVVADRGPGIPADQAGRVFERFHRSARARSSGRGAGLGLAITRRIVQQHGGDIRVDAPDQPGCRLVIDVPAAAHDRRSHR